jgi:hypothetical protein
MYKRNVVSIQVSLNPAESSTLMHLTNETTTNTLFAKQSTLLGQSSLLQAPWRPYLALLGLDDLTRILRQDSYIVSRAAAARLAS